MSKKVALLVTASLRARVIVDVPDDWDEKTEEELWFGNGIISDELQDAIAKQTEEHFYSSLNNAEMLENIVEVVNDIEMPYEEGRDNGEPGSAGHFCEEKNTSAILSSDAKSTDETKLSDVPEMICLLFIRGQEVGRHDYDPDELCRYLNKCKQDGSIEYMSIWKRCFTDRRTMESYLDGLSDAGCSEDYAVCYWDPYCDESDAQGKVYAELCDILSEYL